MSAYDNIRPMTPAPSISRALTRECSVFYAVDNLLNTQRRIPEGSSSHVVPDGRKLIEAEGYDDSAPVVRPL